MIFLSVCLSAETSQADTADETAWQIDSIWQTRQMKRSGRPGRGNGPADQLKPAVIKTHGSMTKVFEFKIIYPSLYQPVCLYACLSIIDNALNMKDYFGTAETTRQMQLVQIKIHVGLEVIGQ